MYSKWSGGVASDTLDCGTFTDRHDVVLVAGSKVYVADLRVKFVLKMLKTKNYVCLLSDAGSLEPRTRIGVSYSPCAPTLNVPIP